MISWIADNMSTIVISLILIAIVTFVIYRMIMDKKTGKSGCSHGCQSCAMHGECHNHTPKDK